jgi:hypothetical protein
MICPNPECPDFRNTGSPGEYTEGITTCPVCGTSLTNDAVLLTKVSNGKPLEIKKRTVVVLGIFTAWPIVYMALFMGIFVRAFVSIASGAPGPSGLFKIIMPLHMFTSLEIMVLIVVYIVILFKTNVVAKDKKALWAVVLFLGSIISMPVFWYLYLWKSVAEPLLEQPS